MDEKLLAELKERAPDAHIPCIFVNGNMLGSET